MTQRQKILVVDDSQMCLDVTSFLLKKIDADIVTTTSGKEAINKTIVEDFDLILMDVVMPGIDGFEVIKAIRSDTRNAAIPVIFITGSSYDESQIVKGLSLGAIDFIKKPISQEILHTKANNLLSLQKYKRDLELARDELLEKISIMEIIETERKKIADENKKLADELKERNKELRCLYSISSIIEITVIP